MDDSHATDPQWLVPHKFNDSVSSREQVGKKTSPFLQRPMGERGKTDGGGGEEVGEEEVTIGHMFASQIPTGLPCCTLSLFANSSSAFYQTPKHDPVAHSF